MGGWYQCECQDCDKGIMEEDAFLVHDENGTPHRYCSEECAMADGKELK